MRLWHQKLISHLDRQRLLDAHSECCALRGRGWGRNHSVVNYVFTHDPALLVAYHFKVMNEMKTRGYHPDEIWYVGDYRGTTIGYQPNWCDFTECVEAFKKDIIYPEHNDAYLQECIDNLKAKGIDIE